MFQDTDIKFHICIVKLNKSIYPDFHIPFAKKLSKESRTATKNSVLMYSILLVRTKKFGEDLKIGSIGKKPETTPIFAILKISTRNKNMIVDRLESPGQD